MAWLSEEEVVRNRTHTPVVDVGHPQLVGLGERTAEAFIARIAWHEWGHALSLARCSPEDVSAGSRLLELAPDGVRETIRSAAYRRRDYTHELVAEIYALLIARHRRQASGSRHGCTTRYTTS
jgi:hypothetical protein